MPFDVGYPLRKYFRTFAVFPPPEAPTVFHGMVGDPRREITPRCSNPRWGRRKKMQNPRNTLARS